MFVLVFRFRSILSFSFRSRICFNFSVIVRFIGMCQIHESDSESFRVMCQIQSLSDSLVYADAYGAQISRGQCPDAQ